MGESSHLNDFTIIAYIFGVVLSSCKDFSCFIFLIYFIFRFYHFINLHFTFRQNGLPLCPLIFSHHTLFLFQEILGMFQAECCVLNFHLYFVLNELCPYSIRCWNFGTFTYIIHTKFSVTFYCILHVTCDVEKLCKWFTKQIGLNWRISFIK